jgi:peptide/nickel transport system substrate-binding protein
VRAGPREDGSSPRSLRVRTYLRLRLRKWAALPRPKALAFAWFVAVLLGGSACTKVTPTGSAAAPAANPWTRHGLLRIVSINDPDSLNPIVGNYQIDSDLAELWGGMLFNWSDRNELVPELATEVPTNANGGVSADGKTIVYHLRKNVEFSDGAPFTADDVIFTWHAVMNRNNNVPSTVGFDLITKIDKRDAFTIAVHLRKAYAPFIATFFAPSGTPYTILPEHLLAKYPNINQVAFNSQPVGTGPFVVEHWQRGNKIVFHANPHYWRGPPKLSEIWYTPIPSENTIVTLLQSHQADLEYYGSAVNFAQLSHIAGTTVTLTPFTQYAQLGLNLTTPALADANVRRALWYGIDVPRLIRDVTHGVNTPGSTDQPNFLWAHDPNVAHYAFDPAKARALLAGAGWKAGSDGIRVKDGRRLALTIASPTGNAIADSAGIVVQREWHDLGIDAQVKTYVPSLFFASFGGGGIIQTGKFDVAFFTWVNGTDPDDSVLWMCDQIPLAGRPGQNIYRFCDPKLDRAEESALTHYDRPTRKAAYDAIQRELADDVPAIILWYYRRIAVANSDLKNYRPAHAVSSFWNAYEWDI